MMMMMMDGLMMMIIHGIWDTSVDSVAWINPQVLILFWLQIPVKIKNNSTDLCFYENEGGVSVTGLFENFSAL